MPTKTPTKKKTKQSRYVVLHHNLRWSTMDKTELKARMASGEFDKKADKIFLLGKKIKIQEIT